MANQSHLLLTVGGNPNFYHRRPVFHTNSSSNCSLLFSPRFKAPALSYACLPRPLPAHGHTASTSRASRHQLFLGETGCNTSVPSVQLLPFLRVFSLSRASLPSWRKILLHHHLISSVLLQPSQAPCPLQAVDTGAWTTTWLTRPTPQLTPAAAPPAPPPQLLLHLQDYPGGLARGQRAIGSWVIFSLIHIRPVLDVGGGYCNSGKRCVECAIVFFGI